MNVHHYSFVENKITDIEQIYDVQPGEHARISQYSRGQLQAINSCLQLPELTVHRNVVNGGLLIELSQHRRNYSVVLLERASNAINWMGQTIAADCLMLYPPGKAAQYVLPQSWSSIEFDIEPPLFESLGLLSAEGGEVDNFFQCKVPDKLFNALLSKGKQLIFMAESKHVALGSSIGRLRLRDQLVALLQSALQPTEALSTLSLNSKADGKLVTQAQEMVEQHLCAGMMLNIPDLSNQLNIHERVLYKVFQKNLGISPYAWAHLLRLHQFRQQVLASSATHGVITQTASMLGFNNLSHFSEQFKRQFGETPRQFLQRCKNS
jgi:AraC-like DNA-binding protein